MTRATPLRVAFVLGALILLLAPTFVRVTILGHNRRPYDAGAIATINVAATPVPTATPLVLAPDSMLRGRDLRPGPVVVDLAHGNRLQRSQFEPLAAALARRGIGVRFWMSKIDILSISNYLDYPDQSAELAPLLADASALVVASPFFLWSQEEIALVERFVADGGHLLLISDPDVVGDMAQDINNLAEPFGIVFNDDYLYDTIRNDGNYTHIFPAEFSDQGERLAGRTLALYGARSIGGEVTPQLRSAQTTLSNIRSGVTGFTVMALGGLANRNTLGRVLALSDFDVLTSPFVERHDNGFLLEFVAGFLSSSERRNTITDFPAYLGKEVALVFGNASAVDAPILLVGSRLQRSLEMTGRNLTLAGTTLLTATLATGSKAPELDLIVLADYTMMDEEVGLLRRIGFKLVEVPPDQAASDGSLPAEGGAGNSTPVAVDAGPAAADRGAEVSATPAAPDTATPTPAGAEGSPVDSAPATPGAGESPTPAATPVPAATPAPIRYLEKADGLRLVARQTVIIAQLQLSAQHRLVAVLGNDNSAIGAGVERLLAGDYRGCLTGPDLAVCSYEGAPDPTPTPARSTPTPEAGATPTPMATSAVSEVAILVVDDNDRAAPSELAEADTYLLGLSVLGYRPILWSTDSQGVPPASELRKYRWVIWSSAGYENGGPSLADLDAILSYINAGGRLTISSRRPFFGMSRDDPSPIVDITVESALPELVRGLPSQTIRLPNGLPPLIPLQTNDAPDGPKVALRRGPDSGSPGAPVLFLATDDSGPSPSGARLMVLGMNIAWLPDGFDQQLIRNMADVMLAER